jgi:hypothetical protein
MVVQAVPFTNLAVQIVPLKLGSVQYISEKPGRYLQIVELNTPAASIVIT